MRLGGIGFEAQLQKLTAAPFDRHELGRLLQLRCGQPKSVAFLELSPLLCGTENA